jgi:two-component system phosphate regulon response regulator PhoB
MSTPRVLIVGGDRSWVDSLREQIGRDHFEIIAAADANQAVQWATEIRCDLIVVAPELPDDGTLELCRGLRGQSSPAAPPPILLPPVRPAHAKNAAGDGDDQQRNVADEIAELIQHAAGVFDDLGTRGEAESCVRRNGIEIDRACYRVTVDGREAKLTPTEFRILWTLISNPGFVFSRQQLLELCVGDNAPSYERTIDVHIKAIRQKLEHRADSIETVRGIGYRFRDLPDQGRPANSQEPPA